MYSETKTRTRELVKCEALQHVDEFGGADQAIVVITSRRGDARDVSRGGFQLAKLSR